MERFRYLMKKVLTRRVLILAAIVLTVGVGSLVVGLAGSEVHGAIPGTSSGKGVFSALFTRESADEDLLTRVVKATAYNALPGQTDSTPDIGAWGDRVRPGIIAVSRDLEALGLKRGQQVYVDGYGPMTVMDRMHERKRNQIDIFMDCRKAAKSFGVKNLTIQWKPLDECPNG